MGRPMNRPPPLLVFTYTELADAVKREVGYRRFVYPKRVEAGKMKQAEADRQVAMFEAIEAHLRELAAGERLI